MPRCADFAYKKAPHAPRDRSPSPQPAPPARPASPPLPALVSRAGLAGVEWCKLAGRTAPRARAYPSYRAARALFARPLPSPPPPASAAPALPPRPACPPQDHPFEKRQAEAARIREKYPDRIPVICEKEPRSDIPPVLLFARGRRPRCPLPERWLRAAPQVDKRKYLIPMDLTVGQFVYVIRKRISIPPEKAIFIFVNNTLPPTAALMSTVYENHRDPDGEDYHMRSRD